ncbi:Bug family tripartite tricarboxylate transporter substrate binding protein [Lutibaculum baratangense]|uniref:Tricarboxylate transport protein TctC n=1 Tax=Lutibaculum baratangense AMV1 TaxID=631454 RepID=V4TMR7_9HYPH|nr:tripartite tricarboxylate transporter substrate binding protein [Lutibaculum baratangense]ESR27038.1 Tricarboxylate transport protein TctC [Lutibaculum baratangense AMV1]
MIFRTLLAATTMLVGAGLAAQAQDYPDHELQGIIMWGAGGATDVVAHAVTPAAEEALGQSIVLVNRPGGTGAISTAFVSAAPADGYTILYGAENPQLHGVMGLSEIDYADFYPVNILGRGVGVVVARADAPWNSFSELVADANERPGEIKMGSTGPGGIPFVVNAMLNAVAPYEVTAVPFDGEGPALTALQGGHVDFIPSGISAAAELIRAGKVKPLAVINTEPVEQLPNVPAITDEYPEMEKYLPWGPFYGVFVRQDVPEEAKTALVEAFDTAASSEDFVELMKNRGNIVMNISGDEAREFLDDWQSTTTWLLQEAGETKVSPEDLGIPKP